LHVPHTQALVMAGMFVIAVHVAASALFFIEASAVERLVWAVIVIVSLGAGVWAYIDWSPPGRAALCLAVGLPALLFGVGIHAAHVAQIGFSTSDFTGIPMLIAGVVLTVIGGIALVCLIHTWWRRLLLIPPALILAFFVLFPMAVAIIATNMAHYPCCAETPADRNIDYEDVSFPTPEGLTLSAWFIQSVNGATVITVHGAGKNRATTMDEAEVLVRHGYGVLMIDVEGYGDSEGRANAFGWVGARDVHAAVDYLRTRPDVDADRIGGLGLSMGGEILLQAAGESEALKAVVAEGATGRTAADFSELSGSLIEPIVPFHWVLGGTMQLLAGVSPPPPLKQMAQQIPPRRVLLIAADLEEETKLMGLYLELGGSAFDLWSIPESKHEGSYDLHPEEWEHQVIAFYDEALLNAK
jgi:uncharacterized protein